MFQRKRLNRVATLFAVVAIAFIYHTQSNSVSGDVQPTPTESANEAVRETMRKKLAHSKLILNGLVTRDFEMMEKAAGDLKQISLSAPQPTEGDQTDNELYEHFRLEFLRTCTLVERMSKEENLEGAAFAYQSLTANCLACHNYLDRDDHVKVRTGKD